jgi:6-pyruvoyltetrahydropterin/6-carboxytetrahydropterin synthase
MESWSIKVQKDYLKFSAAHFLIFPDGTAERLHGHNYKVFVEIESALDEHGLVLNFQDLKPRIRDLVDELDEHLLIPGEHAELRSQDLGDGRIEISYRERRYAVPTQEVIVLPINNTSAENLAGYLGHRLLNRLEQDFPGARIQRITVGVEETPGQQGVVTIKP